MLSWFKKKTEETTAPVAAPVVEDAPVVEEKNWLERLSDGLSKSTGKLTGGLSDLLTKRRLDLPTLEKMEEALIAADIGPRLAATITEEFGKQRMDTDVTDDEVKAYLAEAMAARLQGAAQGFTIDDSKKPFVILMVGVNGAGKTTTLGKLAAQFQQEGRKVTLAAGDTFRAAAVEQLQEWGRRAGVPVIARQTGADAAGLAYDALAEAKANGSDILMIDTAGRLHNKADLMAELQKIIRALKKADASAPHATLLVLDATTGQNAVAQTQTFKEMVDVTGLVVTKLDGTAKGGIVVALADQYRLPIVAVGIGEGIADLQPFAPVAYARSLVGLPPAA